MLSKHREKANEIETMELVGKVENLDCIIVGKNNCIMVGKNKIF
jgi:hypothetical protein